MSILYTTTCDNCEEDVEIELHGKTPGSFDPSGRSHTDGPPEPAYSTPGECPECGSGLLLDTGRIEQHVRDHKEAEGEYKAGLR